MAAALPWSPAFWVVAAAAAGFSSQPGLFGGFAALLPGGRLRRPVYQHGIFFSVRLALAPARYRVHCSSIQLRAFLSSAFLRDAISMLL